MNFPLQKDNLNINVMDVEPEINPPWTEWWQKMMGDTLIEFDHSPQAVNCRKCRRSVTGIGIDCDIHHIGHSIPTTYLNV